MYKSRSIIPKENITDRKMFIPLTICYELHSAIITANGLMNEEYENFDLKPPYVEYSDDISWLTEENGLAVIEINYHYKKSPSDKVCHDFAKKIINSSWFGDHITSSPDVEQKRKDIFIKHYIDAQFSLDCGLYKESALNFGTCLETILNKYLTNKELCSLINDCNKSLSTYKDEMHEIRKLRNRVHPNQLLSFDNVSRKEAYECRSILEKILKIMA